MKPASRGQPDSRAASRPRLFISGLDVGKTAATVLNDAVVNGKTPPAASYAPTSIVDANNLQDDHGSDLAEELRRGACSKAPAAGGKPLFVVINKSADQQYFIDLQNSFVDARQRCGADAKKFDAKLDPNLGVSLVNDAISAGAKGIAITVPDQTIGPAIAKAAKDAGVVLIATDDSIKDADGKPVPFVGFDGKDMGKKVGEAAAQVVDRQRLAEGHGQEGGRAFGGSADPLGLQRPHRQREGGDQGCGRDRCQIFPVPYTGETLVVAGCGRPDHHGSPRSHQLGRLCLQRRRRAGYAERAGDRRRETRQHHRASAWARMKPASRGLPDSRAASRLRLFISGLDVGKTAATVLNDAVVNGKTPAALRMLRPRSWIRSNFKTYMDPISLANCSK